ncbi:MAG: acyl-CoA dehydrogenase family protein [Bdellovibrionaceae bacterium]|nr:acyl-CoA dehydrogenase family protein [Pseudobdellovibrionaceae bacterium]
MSAYDFLNIDRLFTTEELMVKKTTADFVRKEVYPLLQQAHREENFPKQIIPRLAEMNLLGSNIKGYGCAGLSPRAYGLIMQELERGDSGLRSFCSVQGALVMWAIFSFGSEDQKKEFLPQLATAKKIGCFGLTEPDAGSDPASLKCHAKKTKGGWILNGNKMWITNGSIADLAVVWAQLDSGKIQGFLVEKDFKGFSTSLMKGKFSLRVSITSELHFQDCFVPESHILPQAQGLKSALECLNQARYGIAWGVVGSAMECYQTALNYSGQRMIFNKALSSTQLAQAKLVKMIQNITLAQLLNFHISVLKEKGELKPEQISLAKMNNCKISLEIARQARDMLGANGIIDEYPVIRHLLNLETVSTYEGTEDIHRLSIGRSLTGYQAFK